MDLGLNRVGTRPGPDTHELAKGIDRLDGVELAGIMGYEGHLLTVQDPAEKREKIEAAMGVLVQCRDRLLNDDLNCSIVSAGGTGSYQITSDCEGITELQCGGGIFADPLYRLNMGVEGLDYALTVLATVVSRPALERAVLDCGRKTQFPDFQKPLVKGHPGATVTHVSAEHCALALEGEALFYRGEVAAAVQRDHVNGGQLSRADLERYTVRSREPLKLKVAGVQVLTNPPPSAGGTLCAFGLSLLDAATLHAMGADDVHHQLAIADILQATHEARIEAIAGDRAADRAADPNASMSGVLDPALLSRYRHEVMGRLHARRGTTHISIIDAAGNLASVTVSNGEGSGYVVPGTGIVMNNMLGEADLNPGGFQRWVPGQRMTSMMMPSAVRWADGTQVACGSGGSNRIRSALLQVLLRMVVHRNTPQAAVLAPRLHLEDGLLSVEGGFDIERIAPLLAAWPRHHLWESRNLFFGGAHTVRSGPNACDGIGDPRRAGVFVRIPA